MTRQPSPFASSLHVLARCRFAPLFALLTFSVPSNLLAEYATYTIYGSDDLAAVFRISSFVGAIMIPLYALIVIRAASASIPESQPLYGNLIKSSVNNWARVFKARFLATFLVGLGTLALVVPGVVLAVRYAFVEVLAIAEDTNGGQARARSAKLASGRSRPILRLLLSVFAAAALAALIAGLPLGLWPQYDNFIAAAIGDALFDVVLSTLYGGAWFIYRAATADSPSALPEPIA